MMTPAPLAKIMVDLTNCICSDCCKPIAFTTDSTTGPTSLQGVHGEALLVSRLDTTYLKQEGLTNAFAFCIKARKTAVIFKLSWR